MAANLSYEQIASARNVSKGVVAKYVGLASAAGLDWNSVEPLNELQLARRRLPRVRSAQSIAEPDWPSIHRELDRKGVTLMLLWQEYQATHAESRTCKYTQFCAVSDRRNQATSESA